MGIITINYIDRVNIGVASPTLMKIFNLNPAEVGILMSAFFWSYLICMIPAGHFLNHVGPRKVVFLSCLGWGIATVCTAAVNGFISFLGVRILLGITEAPGYPGAARVVSVWIPNKERTFASACFDACSRAGNAFAPPLVVWIIMQWGWQMSFVITGLLAVGYAFVWLAFYREPEDHPKITKSELDYIRQDEVLDADGNVKKTDIIPIWKLFTYPRMLALCTAYFLYMYFWTTFNLWVPAYLVQAKGFNLKAMGIAAMYPYIAGIAFELISGKLWDIWLANGASVNTLRRTGMGVGMLGSFCFTIHGYCFQRSEFDNLLVQPLNGNVLHQRCERMGDTTGHCSPRPGWRCWRCIQLRRQPGFAYRAADYRLCRNFCVGL